MELSNKIMAFIVSVTVAIILIGFLYFDTNIGYVSATEFYTPMYAPLWFESLITIIFIPLMVYSYVYDKLEKNISY